MSRHQKQRKKPMNDLISRQAAIDAILGITPMRNTIPLDSAIFNIEKLPSAEPELKHGKWIERWHEHKHVIGDMACSVCGAQMLLTFPKYCPNCGAKMNKEEETI